MYPLKETVQVYSFEGSEDSVQYVFNDLIKVGIYNDLEICISVLLKEKSVWNQALSNRGNRIWTCDLTAPSRARYQATPYPGDEYYSKLSLFLQEFFLVVFHDFSMFFLFLSDFFIFFMQYTQL